MEITRELKVTTYNSPAELRDFFLKNARDRLNDCMAEIDELSAKVHDLRADMVAWRGMVADLEREAVDKA